MDGWRNREAGGEEQGSIRRVGWGGGPGPKNLCTKNGPDQIFPTVNSIAHRQSTSKREGEQSVNQSVRHEVIQETPTPIQTPKRVKNT